MARPPSRDDVGRKLVFELREPVPQQKLAFLEALQLQLVRLASVAQRLDGGVEIAMLFAQPFNVSGQRIAFLLRELPVDHLKIRVLCVPYARAAPRSRTMGAPFGRRKTLAQRGARRPESARDLRWPRSRNGSPESLRKFAPILPKGALI